MREIVSFNSWPNRGTYSQRSLKNSRYSGCYRMTQSHEMHLTDRQAGNQTDRSGLVQQVQCDVGRLAHFFSFAAFKSNRENMC